jgi:GAF domain-containing protein
MLIPDVVRPPKGERRISWLAILVIVFVIALAAIAANTTLRNSIDKSKQLEYSLLRLQALAYSMSSLEWQSVANQEMSAEVVEKVQNTRDEIDQIQGELDQLDPNAASIRSIHQAYTVYDSALTEEFGLIASGDIAQARLIDSERVDPAFSALNGLLTTTVDAYHVNETQLNRAGNIGFDVLIFLIAASITLLFWRVQKTQTAVERKRLDEIQSINLELQENKQILDQRIGERTQNLEQRNITLQTVIEAARLASQAKNESDLIERSVQLLAQNLKLDHVGIYLANENDEFALLKATNSPEGQALLASEYRLNMTRAEITYSYSVAEMLRYQVGEKRYYVGRPLQLADTKASLNFPLVASQRLIGLINLQTLSPDPQFADQQALQTFADQIALAIANARLVEQLQGRVKEVGQLAGQTVQSAWEQISGGAVVGYRYDQLQVLASGETFPAKVNRDLLAAKPATYVTTDKRPRARIIAPIVLRGNVIGTVGYENNDPRHTWLADETTLLETVASRVSLALENTRLVAEAQERADRERVLGQAAARMRETLDIDTVIQTAVREIQQALDLKAAEVRLALPASDTSARKKPAVKAKKKAVEE